jgi:hypothetical protein
MGRPAGAEPGLEAVGRGTERQVPVPGSRHQVQRRLRRGLQERGGGGHPPALPVASGQLICGTVCGDSPARVPRSPAGLRPPAPRAGAIGVPRALSPGPAAPRARAAAALQTGRCDPHRGRPGGTPRSPWRPAPWGLRRELASLVPSAIACSLSASGRCCSNPC